MGQIIHPKPVAYKDIDLSWMAGRVISEVSFHEPALWHFAFGADASLGVECLWRIIEHGRVVLCGEDHGQQFGLPAPLDAVERATALLSGRRVAGAQLREATADVV